MFNLVKVAGNGLENRPDGVLANVDLFQETLISNTDISLLLPINKYFDYFSIKGDMSSS